MEFSVVIPLVNEAEVLPLLQERINKVFENLRCEYEIIYVDDGSTDSSLEILKNLKTTYPFLKVISFEENQGQSAAFFAGFKMSEGKWIITMDSDLQNPPEEIPKLLAFKNDFDFITGVRENRKDSFIRKFSSKVARFFRWVILKDITQDTGCSLRVFKREVTEQLPYFKNFHRFFTFLARQRGFKIKEVPVKHDERRFGKSKYGVLKRAGEGIFDLIGVLWLKKRLIRYKVKYKT